MKLLLSETLCFKGFQTPKDTARRVPTGMPLKRTESAFKRTQKFKKSAIYYPDFGIFLPSQNSETLINSHFQFLR